GADGTRRGHLARLRPVGDPRAGRVKLSHRRGTLRLQLDAVERSVLAAMLSDLAAALEPGALDADDPVRVRLYPDGYVDDVEAAAEFRALTEESLGTERAARIQECLTQLQTGEDIVVDRDAGARWITALNDLRLAVGTRLGIEDEEH